MQNTMVGEGVGGSRWGKIKFRGKNKWERKTKEKYIKKGEKVIR